MSCVGMTIYMYCASYIVLCQYLSLHILGPFNSCVTKGIALYLYVVMLQHLYLFYSCVTIGFLHVPCPLCRFVSSFLSRYTASNIYCNDGQNRPLPYVVTHVCLLTLQVSDIYVTLCILIFTACHEIYNEFYYSEDDATVGTTSKKIICLHQN